MKLAHLFSQLSSEPWFIAEISHAECLAAHVLAFDMLAARADQEADISKALSIAFAQRPAATMDKATGIAEISIFGPLARNLAPLQRAAGMTDFAQIHGDFAAAMEAGAKGILLRVDSPGGTCSGTPEAAALIAESSVPVVAHLAQAGSAAYYLAAGASRLIAAPSAEVGSIGIMMPRMDLSRALANAGVVADTITNTAGDLKGINPTGALTAAQREHLVATADALFDEFRAHVLAHRAVPDSAMRGQTLSGSAALAANLCDELGDVEDARAYLLTLV